MRSTAERTASRTPARQATSRTESPDQLFWKGVARAFGGALFFAMPLLMTMEMWWLGFYMDRLRLALLLAVMVPLLVGLDHYSGFKDTSSWGEDVIDAFVAYGVGFVASAAVLYLFDVIHFSMALPEIIGKVALQAVPASFGAVLANSQLVGDGQGDGSSADQEQNGGGGQGEAKRTPSSYAAELLFMTAGAVFLAFNLAPTEEMILIAFKMSYGHVIALGIVSLAMMHAFVYSVGFRGTPTAPEGTPGWKLFSRFTLVGYAIALLVSAYVLWTFGRFEDHAVADYFQMSIVLGFPASLGAAAARLIL